MGIVNCTPDSFSGDGCGGDARAAAERGLALAAEGADLLDIGGESTRPGAAPVPVEVELARVVPVVEALARQCTLPLSVDTSKAEVAEAALRAGACIVNDVWGLRRDRRIADVAARHGAALVLVHNRPARAAVDGLGGMYPEVPYRDLLGEVAGELAEAAGWANAAGVPPGHIWLDPGLGFGKTPAQNLELLRRLPELRRRLWGAAGAAAGPLLVGPSRKSFIGRVLGLPVGQRLEGTAACVALCVAGGADIVRVHDVRVMGRVARMADAVCRGPSP